VKRGCNIKIRQADSLPNLMSYLLQVDAISWGLQLKVMITSSNMCTQVVC